MIRVVFFGTSAFGQPSLESIQKDSRFHLALVVTQPPRRAGRGLSLVNSPIHDWAIQNQFPVKTFLSLQSPEAEAYIRQQKPDVFLVTAFGLILPSSLLSLVPDRALNIHASLLPKYRGPSPIQTSLFQGEAFTGVTYMLMTSGVDQGDMVGQRTHPIADQIHAPELEKQLSLLAAENIGDVLSGVATGTANRTAQDHTRATYTKKLSRLDGQADWTDAAREVRRLKAYDPWPGCWSVWYNQRLKFIEAEANEEIQNAEPGTVIPWGKRTWAVACQQGTFIPHRLVLAGSGTQASSTMVDRPGFIGSRLG